MRIRINPKTQLGKWIANNLDRFRDAKTINEKWTAFHNIAVGYAGGPGQYPDHDDYECAISYLRDKKLWE
jgi:hypothetical protein